jgi:hypothetical protein
MPLQMMTEVPSRMPIWDMARGMASTPAPTMVLTRLMTEEMNEAWPAKAPVSRRRRGLAALAERERGEYRTVLSSGLKAGGRVL